MIGKFDVLVVDDEADKRHLLTTALRLSGYEVREAADGRAALVLIDSYTPDLIVADVMMPAMSGYELVRAIRANPETRYIPVLMQSAAATSAEDQLISAEIGALGHITDVTDLDLLRAQVKTLLEFKRHQDNCEEAAMTDHLTGLANRRRFEHQLEREIARTERSSRPFCLVLWDIDHFKLVNDTYGHAVGDLVLQALSEELRECVREIDLAARIGGEEFALILTDTNLDEALEAVARFRIKINSLRVEPIGGITASYGVAEYPSCASSNDLLYKAADAALYRAKRAGRDRIECSPRLAEPLVITAA